MPIWFALCLLLFVMEAYAYRHAPALHPLLVVIAIWAATIAYSVLMLVPINNRIAFLQLASLPANWRQAHEKWDTLHRLRILFLIVALSFLSCGLVSITA